MSEKSSRNGTPGASFGLRSRFREGPLDRDSSRFHIFLVDTGWNAGVSKALREHIKLFQEFHPQDPLYILTREQSVQILKAAPEHIGRDPMVIVYDLYSPPESKDRGKTNYRGFRLNLGLIRHPEQAVAKLQEFLRFIARNRTAVCLDCEVQHELHREGLGNFVKILREASEASLELL
jgi:hypothetical protein